MNKQQIFIEQLKKNKYIKISDILKVAEHHLICFKSKTSKTKVIDTIVENIGYKELFTAFSDIIKIPSWEVASYYNIPTRRINELKNIGAIKEEPTEKILFNKIENEYFTAYFYPISVLNYNAQELNEEYKKSLSLKDITNMDFCNFVCYQTLCDIHDFISSLGEEEKKYVNIAYINDRLNGNQFKAIYDFAVFFSKLEESFQNIKEQIYENKVLKKAR